LILTTKKEEKVERQKLIEQGYSMEEAIDIMIKKEMRPRAAS